MSLGILKVYNVKFTNSGFKIVAFFYTPSSCRSLLQKESLRPLRRKSLKPPIYFKQPLLPKQCPSKCFAGFEFFTEHSLLWICLGSILMALNSTKPRSVFLLGMTSRTCLIFFPYKNFGVSKFEFCSVAPVCHRAICMRVGPLDTAALKRFRTELSFRPGRILF